MKLLEEKWLGPPSWKKLNDHASDVDVEERLLSSASESGDRSDLSERPVIVIPESRKQRSGWMIWITFLNVLVLGVTVTVASVGTFSPRKIDANSCVKAISGYSPILDTMPVELHPTQLNGTLWPGESPSWSRKEPGDAEMEAMWESFEEMPTFPITRKEVLALGKDPDTVARFPQDVFGLGDDAYIASLDALHKIHCLNELRKMAFADYGEETPTKKGHGRLWWVHLRHCVDMLVQDTMCHADADVITYRWVDTQDKPFPDFSLNRQCRSLDDLVRYQEAHKVDPQKYLDMAKPETGVTTVPMEPGYYVAYGFADSELYPNGKGYDGPWPNQDNWFGFPPVPDT